MGSFKIQKSKGAKKEAKSAGGLALIIGLAAGLFIHPLGFLFAALGLVFLLASLVASE